MKDGTLPKPEISENILKGARELLATYAEQHGVDLDNLITNLHLPPNIVQIAPGEHSGAVTPIRKPELSKGGETLVATISPKILEHGKFFRGNTASEFYELEYTEGMNHDSKKYRDSTPVSLACPDGTVTFGYWAFDQKQSASAFQALSIEENKYGGSGTNRPFSQKRYTILSQNSLVDLYAQGVRPLRGMLVDASQDNTFMLKRYDEVPGLIDGSHDVTTNIEEVWKLHQEENYKRLSILAAEAVLARRAIRIGNPVVLEHSGELTNEMLANMFDTINVICLAVNPQIKTVCSINSPSMDRYDDVDLVVRNVTTPAYTSIYPSWILNRPGKEQEIIPGHYSTPDMPRIEGVASVYSKLHDKQDRWVNNHQAIFEAK